MGKVTFAIMGTDRIVRKLWRGEASAQRANPGA